MSIFTITGPGGSTSVTFTIDVSTNTGIYNYATLKVAVADFLNRQDLTTRMNTAANIAEARIRRLLRDRTVGPALFTLSEGVSVPDDCGELRTMRFADTGSGSYAIAITSPSAVSLRRALRFPTTALPEAVAVVQRKLLVTPLLSRPYQVEITYYQTVPPLVNDTDTNWLLDEAPDVYLYGMLYAFAQFLVDDERVPMWESAFITGMKELERARERREYGGAPLEFVNEYTF